MVLGKHLKTTPSVMSVEQLEREWDAAHERLRELTASDDFSAVMDALIVAESAWYKAIRNELIKRENEPVQLTLEDWLNAPKG